MVIDNADVTQKLMDEYWKPMWKCSFTGEDVDGDEVMDGLNINRDGEETKDEKHIPEAANYAHPIPNAPESYGDNDESNSDNEN